MTQLQGIISAYQERKYIEDLEAIEALGGIDQILKHLQTSLEKGIDIDSKDSRDIVYGSNKRAEHERNSFCDLVGE
jgi:aspartyl aminopeptidase